MKNPDFLLTNDDFMKREWESNNTLTRLNQPNET